MNSFERNQLAKVIQSAQMLKAYCSNNVITQHKNNTIALKHCGTWFTVLNLHEWLFVNSFCFHENV